MYENRSTAVDSLEFLARFPQKHTMPASDSETSKEKNSKKRPAEDTAEEDEKKLQARREANRMHAFKSRQRSKILLQELQQTVETLRKDKSELERQNAVLRAQVDVLNQQNASLMQHQQIILARAGGTASATTAPATTGAAVSAPAPTNAVPAAQQPAFAQMLPTYATQQSGQAQATTFYGGGESATNQDVQQFVLNISPAQFQQMRQQQGLAQAQGQASKVATENPDEV